MGPLDRPLGSGGCREAADKFVFGRAPRKSSLFFWSMYGIVESKQIPYTGKGGTCTRGSPTADMKAALSGEGGAAIGTSVIGP